MSSPGDEISRKVPRSRIGRFAKLARLTAGLAKDAAGGMARKAMSRASGARDAAAQRLHQEVAERLFRTLGEMKGLAMKAGQLLSYINEFIPEEVRPIYTKVLGGLQVKARPLPPEVIWQTIEDDLGQPHEELFPEFDTEPVAAASIGQVYRARLAGGMAVAVKVQYPGIAEAVESDLRNIDLFRKIFSLILPEMDVDTYLEDLRDRIGEEVDYECELNNQLEFVRVWENDPHIHVPRIFPKLSGRRVLVSEFVEGMPYEEMLATSTQEERNQYGRVLFRYVFESLYLHGIFNADPHPGNYLFMPDGQVTFLDFGCVQRFDREALEAFTLVRRLAQQGDWAGVRRDMMDAYGLPDDMDDEEREYVVEYIRFCLRPILEDAPFRFTTDYTKELVDLSYRGARIGVRKAVRKGVRELSRQGMLFLNRVQYGFYSILARMEAEDNWYQLTDAIDQQLAAVSQQRI